MKGWNAFTVDFAPKRNKKQSIHQNAKWFILNHKMKTYWGYLGWQTEFLRPEDKPFDKHFLNRNANVHMCFQFLEKVGCYLELEEVMSHVFLLILCVKCLQIHCLLSVLKWVLKWHKVSSSVGVTLCRLRISYVGINLCFV